MDVGLDKEDGIIKRKETEEDEEKKRVSGGFEGIGRWQGEGREWFLGFKL